MLPPGTAAPDIGTALTKRESEVLSYVAQGHTNKQVAQALHLSAATIDKHLGHAFGKLGACSRAQAVVRAQRAGLLTADHAESDQETRTVVIRNNGIG